MSRLRYSSFRIARASQLVVGVLFSVVQIRPLASQAAVFDVRAFDHALDSLVRANHLPGASVAIVKDGRIAWSRGYGFADLARQTPATARTPYRLASVSKPLAATVLMKLVEEGKLTLDAPMRDFNIHAWFEPNAGSWATYPDRYRASPITVRHVLTHTSQSTPPGNTYAYNGNIYADLTWVLESVTKESYPVLMRDRLFAPLGMTRTISGQLVPWGQDVAREIATPYALKDGRAETGTYPGFGIEPFVDVKPWNLNPAFALPAVTDSARRALLGSRYTPLYSSQTAAGVVSTVEDLARFDLALDAGRIVSAATREQMFTASRDTGGKALPYGLGWFVEEVDGRKIVWHYGWFPPTVSALYLKIPDRNITLILLANTDALSAGMSWTRMGIRASPYARVFLEHFAKP